jgi:hypothetical protein
MNRLKRAVVTAAAVVVVAGGAAVVAPQPALASSGMSCTVQFGSRTAWFYCNGSQNVYRPWQKIWCVLLGLTTTRSHEYPGTMYAPFSFSESLTCPFGYVVYNSDWGPR